MLIKLPTRIRMALSKNEMCDHVFHSSPCAAFILEHVPFLWMKVFLLTKRGVEHLVPGTKYPSRFDILLLVFIFPLTEKHPVHFFKEVIFFFSVTAILNKSFHLHKACGAIHLMLSRPVLFQQSDLYTREDEIQFDMFVIVCMCMWALHLDRHFGLVWHLPVSSHFLLCWGHRTALTPQPVQQRTTD